MKDQPNIFFVVLTARHSENPLAININDITHIMPAQGGGSAIHLRGYDGAPLCAEMPDEVVSKINAAVQNVIVSLARTAIDIARDL